MQTQAEDRCTTKYNDNHVCVRIGDVLVYYIYNNSTSVGHICTLICIFIGFVELETKNFGAYFAHAMEVICVVH